AAVAAIVAPSWERARLPDALAAALDALERYVAAALEALERGGDRAPLSAMRREVGVALESAEVSLERMLAEPRALHQNTAGAVFVLTYARRISIALTALCEARAARGEADHLPPCQAVRNYVIAVLEVTKRFIATGQTATLLAPTGCDPSLSRLLHHAELLATVSRPLGRTSHEAPPSTT
ncbi:MAG TPA: hypothetical protein VN253_20515, partial [Kofleriaceae bacterium]|nr:hypothetical protein [Kofleriaceae bacterium]